MKGLIERPRTRNRRAEPIVPIPPHAYGQLRAYIIRILKQTEHPFHNCPHSCEVSRYAVAYGRSARCIHIELQLLDLAALLHDFEHAGYTYRQLVAIYRCSVRSNEEHAAFAADIITEHFLPRHLRRVLQQMITRGTSFGQNNRANLPPAPLGVDLYRAYQPTTMLEKLLALADISNFRKGPELWVADSLNVLREAREDTLPATFKEYIDGRYRFLGFVAGRIDMTAPHLSAQMVRRIQADYQVVVDFVRLLETDLGVANRYERRVMEVVEKRRKELARFKCRYVTV